MTPEEAIASSLEAITDLNKKVYPIEGLKNATAPFIVYEYLSASEEDCLDGPSGLKELTLRVHCVARTYASLIWLSGMARSTLLGLQGQTLDGLTIEHVTVQQASPDLKEREADLYRRAFALRMNYQEEVTHE